MFHVIYIHLIQLLPHRFSFLTSTGNIWWRKNNSYASQPSFSCVLKTEICTHFSWALAFLDDLCIKIMQNNNRKRVKMCSLSYGIEIEIENTQMKNGGEDFVNFDNGF